jgi:mutator protein MutT
MRVAILWLINEKGEILLSQRAAHMSTDASMWGPSVSGVIEEGETPEQAAMRETNEELGIDPMEVIPLHHLHNPHHDHSDGKKRDYFIYYSIVSSELPSKFKLEPDEVATTRWITLKDLKKEQQSKSSSIIIASDKPLWSEIFTYLEKALKQ